jgi:DNA-binding transcriptional LysR family regulator
MNPRQLAEHACIAFTAMTPVADSWTFQGNKRSFTVSVRPRLIVNTGEGAIEAAVGGMGLICALSYQVIHHVAARRLRRVLAEYEPPPRPIHVLHPAGRHLSSKVRLFIDTAVEELRHKFAKS